MRFKRTAGLSVLEVLVAMAILAIAALGLIAALTRVMFAQDASSNQTVARLLAEGELQKAVLAGNVTREQVTQSLLVGQGTTPTVFRIAEPKFLALSPEPVVSSGRSEMGVLYKVSVKVTWDDSSEGVARSVERGRQSVEVAKTVYLEQ